jgi:hypothetical protein
MSDKVPLAFDGVNAVGEALLRGKAGRDRSLSSFSEEE